MGLLSKRLWFRLKTAYGEQINTEHNESDPLSQALKCRPGMEPFFGVGKVRRMKRGGSGGDEGFMQTLFPKPLKFPGI